MNMNMGLGSFADRPYKFRINASSHLTCGETEDANLFYLEFTLVFVHFTTGTTDRQSVEPWTTTPVLRNGATDLHLVLSDGLVLLSRLYNQMDAAGSVLNI